MCVLFPSLSLHLPHVECLRARCNNTAALWVNTPRPCFNCQPGSSSGERRVSGQQLVDTEGRAHTAQYCWLKSKQGYKAVESVSQSLQLPMQWTNAPFFLSLSHHSHFGNFQLVSFSNTHSEHIQAAKVMLRLLITRMCEIPCCVPTNSR